MLGWKYIEEHRYCCKRTRRKARAERAFSMQRSPRVNHFIHLPPSLTPAFQRFDWYKAKIT